MADESSDKKVKDHMNNLAETLRKNLPGNAVTFTDEGIVTIAPRRDHAIGKAQDLGNKYEDIKTVHVGK